MNSNKEPGCSTWSLLKQCLLLAAVYHPFFTNRSEVKPNTSGSCCLCPHCLEEADWGMPLSGLHSMLWWINSITKRNSTNYKSSLSHGIAEWRKRPVAMNYLVGFEPMGLKIQLVQISDTTIYWKFGLFNDAFRKYWLSYHRILDIKYMVIVIYFFWGNLLLPYRLQVPKSSNIYFICTFPQTAVDHRLERKIAQTANVPVMQARSDDPNLCRRVLYHLTYVPRPTNLLLPLPRIEMDIPGVGQLWNVPGYLSLICLFMQLSIW